SSLDLRDMPQSARSIRQIASPTPKFVRSLGPKNPNPSASFFAPSSPTRKTPRAAAFPSTPQPTRGPAPMPARPPWRAAVSAGPPRGDQAGRGHGVLEFVTLGVLLPPQLGGGILPGQGGLLQLGHDHAAQKRGVLFPDRALREAHQEDPALVHDLPEIEEVLR